MRIQALHRRARQRNAAGNDRDLCRCHGHNTAAPDTVAILRRRWRARHLYPVDAGDVFLRARTTSGQLKQHRPYAQYLKPGTSNSDCPIDSSGRKLLAQPIAKCALHRWNASPAVDNMNRRTLTGRVAYMRTPQPEYGSNASTMLDVQLQFGDNSRLFGGHQRHSRKR